MGYNFAEETFNVGNNPTVKSHDNLAKAYKHKAGEHFQVFQATGDEARLGHMEANMEKHLKHSNDSAQIKAEHASMAEGYLGPWWKQSKGVVHGGVDEDGNPGDFV
jgi:hypothetical protein